MQPCRYRFKWPLLATGRSVNGQPQGESFDVTSVNDRAHAKWIRGYRVALWFVLILISATVAFGVLRLSASPAPSPYPESLVVTTLGVLVLGLASVLGLLAYSLRVLYRPGACAVSIGTSGIQLHFRNGAPVNLRWDSSKFHLRISSVKAPGPAPTKDTQIAIQSLRYPHFELTTEAFEAVIHAASIAGMNVERSTAQLPGGREWERTWIRRAR